MPSCSYLLRDQPSHGPPRQASRLSLDFAEMAVNAKSGGKGIRVEEITPQDIKHAYSLLTGATYSEALWDTDFEFVSRWIEQAKLQQEHLGKKASRAVTNLLRKFRKSVEVAVSRANDSLKEAALPPRFLIENLDIKRRGKGARALYTIAVPPDHINLPQPTRGRL